MPSLLWLLCYQPHEPSQHWKGWEGNTYHWQIWGVHLPRSCFWAPAWEEREACVKKPKLCGHFSIYCSFTQWADGSRTASTGLLEHTPGTPSPLQPCLLHAAVLRHRNPTADSQKSEKSFSRLCWECPWKALRRCLWSTVAIVALWYP